MKRKEGYYWVMCDNKWCVAEYQNKRWYLAGLEIGYYDTELQQINETKIIPPQ